MKLKDVVYDVGRAMSARSVNWRPDYSPALMRRELSIIQTDLHANAVRLAGREPRRLLEAAEYAASIGLQVLVGPELWNATPAHTLRYVTEVAAATAAAPALPRTPDLLCPSALSQSASQAGVMTLSSYERVPLHATNAAVSATCRPWVGAPMRAGNLSPAPGWTRTRCRRRAEPPRGLRPSAGRGR